MHEYLNSILHWHCNVPREYARKSPMRLSGTIMRSGVELERSDMRFGAQLVHVTLLQRYEFC